MAGVWVFGQKPVYGHSHLLIVLGILSLIGASIFLGITTANAWIGWLVIACGVACGLASLFFFKIKESLDIRLMNQEKHSLYQVKWFCKKISPQYRAVAKVLNSLDDNS